MSDTIISEYFSFTEWYHYALFLVWIILLLAGLRYYHHIEKNFKTKQADKSGTKQGIWLLLFSFILGFVIFLIVSFIPENSWSSPHQKSVILNLITYGSCAAPIFICFLLTLFKYKKQSFLPRFITLSLLIIIYYTSGYISGLILFIILAFIIIIYFFIKFKKILKL